MRDGSGDEHGAEVVDVGQGGAGDDLRIGGRARDLLIGGAGAGHLIGGAGDDILIGGTTAFDANEQALAAIRAEWNSARDFATRAANLAGTGTGAGGTGNGLGGGGSGGNGTGFTPARRISKIPDREYRRFVAASGMRTGRVIFDGRPDALDHDRIREIYGTTEDDDDIDENITSTNLRGATSPPSGHRAEIKQSIAS